MLLAELDELYYARRNTIQRELLPPWAGADRRQAVYEAYNRQLRLLAQEQRAVTEQLLGFPWSAEAQRVLKHLLCHGWSGTDPTLRGLPGAAVFLGHRTAEQSFQVLTLADIYRDRASEITERAQGILLPEDRGDLAKLAGLAGFEPTEEEWRAVTRAKTEFNAAVQRMPRDASYYEALMMQRYGIMPRNSPENQELVDAQARYDTAVRDIFGPERYAEYQRAGDEAYRQTRRITQRLGLDDKAAIRAWDIQRDVQAAMQQLRAIPELDATGRQKALDQITAEAASALQHTLGNPGFATYQQYAGQWLQTPQP